MIIKLLPTSLALGLLLWLLLQLPAQAQVQPQTTPLVKTQFISESGVSLEDLVAGKVGQGVILYYLADRSPEKPSLVVRLSHLADTQEALAQVYQAPPNQDFVPITQQGNQIRIVAPAAPALVIHAGDGWWHRDQLVNYNLDIEINSPIFGMWGAGADTNANSAGWSSQAQSKPGQPVVRVQVRDPQGEGLPKWEWRDLLLPFPGQGFLRANYAERKCNTPVQRDEGVSPLWPFVAQTGLFEQPNGKLLPPIGVNWASAKLTHFSELVTVRNQNCSYSLYTLDRLQPGQLNRVDFEAPFAFYDLSGQGQGYPNLIIRTQHHYALDPWSTQVSEVLQGRPLVRDTEWIRYSWRNAIGDQQMDYKVEVMGFHPYNFDTPLADGAFRVDAPDYEAFPGWVINQNWPIVTFVDATNTNYLSSEGIYEWSPLDQLGIGYVAGLTSQPKPDAFSTIKPGLRGEYRYDKELAPQLYFSPVDHLLHLKGATAGLWALNNQETIRYQALAGTPYLDQWVYSNNTTSPPAMRQLDIFGNHLIYAGEDQVIIRQASVPSSLFESSPPTNPQDWAALKQQLESYPTNSKPADFKALLAQFPGPELTLEGATINDYRTTADGVRFILELKPQFKVTNLEPGFFDSSNLTPGKYVVSVNRAGVLALAAQTPAQLSITNVTLVGNSDKVALAPQLISIQLENNGAEDITNLPLTVIASATPGITKVLTTTLVALSGQTTRTFKVDWTPPSAGVWKIFVNSPGLSANSVAIAVKPNLETGGEWSLAFSGGNSTVLLLTIGLITLLSAIFGIYFIRQNFTINHSDFSSHDTKTLNKTIKKEIKDGQ